MSVQFQILNDLEQGSQEWLSLRKTKITATDASVIMGVNPWKNKLQLYEEKMGVSLPIVQNERMKRGIELEPIARSLFNMQTESNMKPVVIVNDWMMASLDGRDEATGAIIEIKCPGNKDHELAIQGKIPDYYYPQLQHQMYVANVQSMHYYSFDGVNGVSILVRRDQDFIHSMMEQEYRFYECLMNKVSPENEKDTYLDRDDAIWNEYATQWKQINQSLKDLEKQEEFLRGKLISLSGNSNSRGAGISLCQIQRKGNVDYSKIPELKGLDLEKYRKSSSSSWRISCN